MTILHSFVTYMIPDINKISGNIGFPINIKFLFVYNLLIFSSKIKLSHPILNNYQCLIFQDNNIYFTIDDIYRYSFTKSGFF